MTRYDLMKDISNAILGGQETFVVNGVEMKIPQMSVIFKHEPIWNRITQADAMAESFLLRIGIKRELNNNKISYGQFIKTNQGA